ncbi:MAG: protein translocase subunit SecD [Oscillospiraceae bacterium]|jgi:SecD/SecF fusion protein|nr:protein translocase subunit SecD [Oscillospiraceae bacterium]
MHNAYRSKYTFFIVALVTVLVATVVFGLFGRPLSAQNMRFGIDINGGVDAVFEPADENVNPTQDQIDSARSIIETRLDAASILDRDVTNDDRHIFVRFPWKSGQTDFDPAQAIKELGEMAHLTFRDPDGNVVLEGSQVASASFERQTDATTLTYQVNLRLTTEGREAFYVATAALVGQSISIYMDETMISNPTVNSAIDDETCRITGTFTAAEAQTLSNQINSGALPFALTSRNYSTISPMLGTNALEVTLFAGLLAFLLICIGLILYYRLSGVVASIALVLQISGLLLIMSGMQLTLTLPGIAGIILSIGMGVDANIIIAERIRDELRSGKGIDSAISSGFARAFTAVLDGNITTAIAAILMLIFGSGTIKSFGYTLLFGLIMNFVGGVLSTRLMTASLTQFKPFRKPTMFLSAKSLARKETKIINFYQKKKIFYAASGVFALLGIVALLARGGVNLDIQFTGGAILKYEIADSADFDVDTASRVANDALPGHNVTAQKTTDFFAQGGGNKLVLNLAGGDSLNTDEFADITLALQEAFPEVGFQAPVETNNVAPFFGARFLRNGLLAVLLSFLFIMIYVWFRFRKIHGLSAGAMAMLALFHDVLFAFFAFGIFGIPLGESFVAVTLTILGFSINDTIVIYDRLRENMRKRTDLSPDGLVNLSLSETLTRSINTSVTVLGSLLIVFVLAAGNGLDSLTSFALPMAIGTVFGCFSSIGIAGPTWAAWQNHKLKKLPVGKAKAGR